MEAADLKNYSTEMYENIINRLRSGEDHAIFLANAIQILQKDSNQLDRAILFDIIIRTDPSALEMKELIDFHAEMMDFDGNYLLNSQSKMINHAIINKRYALNIMDMGIA